MKKIFSAILAFVLVATSLSAQSKSAYFLDGYNYRHELNPAMSPYRGYVNLMGHYAIGINSNLSATQLLYPSTDGSELYTFLHPEVSAEQFLGNLHPQNMLNLNTGIDILGFGFHAGRGYVSFDTKLQVDLGTNLPKEFFAFLKKGMDSDHSLYDIRNFNVNAKAYASASLGYAYDIFSNLRVGVKAKYLLGLAGVNANIDQMQIDMSSNGWKINTQASLSAYGYGLEASTGTLDADGQQIPTDYITGLKFNTEAIMPAGQGFAFDLGLCYSPIRNLNISAALTNLGGITWDQEAQLQAQSKGEVKYEGFQLDVNTNNETFNQLGQDLSSGMMNMIQFKEVAAAEPYYQALDSRFLVGAEYSAWKKRLSAGLLYTCDYTQFGQFDELIVSSNIRLFKALELSGSYTLFSDYGQSFGASLSLFNALYLSWDHILTTFSPQFIPLDVLTTQVEIGLRMPLGKAKKNDLPSLFYFSE